MTGPERDGREVAGRLARALAGYDPATARGGVDMSRRAITGRLADALAMSSLCLALVPRAAEP